MFSLSLILLLAVSIASAKEVNVPRVLFSKQSHCAGTDMRLSCADDGEPFGEYRLKSLSVTLYTSDSPKTLCKSRQVFNAKGQVCTVDPAGRFSALNEVISKQCTDQRECFVRLPSPQQLQCGDKSYFYGAEIQFQCSEPTRKNLRMVNEKESAKPSKGQLSIIRQRRAASKESFDQNSRQSVDKPGLNSHQDKNDHNDLNSRQNTNGPDFNSGQNTPDNNFNSREHKHGKNDINSRESHKKNDFHSMEKSGDTSRNSPNDHNDSYEQRQGGKRRGSGRRSGGGKRVITSYTKDGRPIYSGLNSGSHTGAVISVVSAMYLVLLLL